MSEDFIVGPDHFYSPELRQMGEHGFSVSVGPLAVAYRGLSAGQLVEFQNRYRPFLWEEDCLHEVALYVGAPEYLLPSADSFLRLEESSHPEGEILLSGDFAAFRPREGGPGRLLVSAPDSLRQITGAVENYLRWMIADLALTRQGFVLHAAGLARDGEAYIFFGHSGAGKSTVCELSPGATLLSDDLVLIMREGDRFLASTTPFRGTLPQGAKEKGFYPMARAFRLHQSREVSTTPLPTGLAVAEILSCCPFISDSTKRLSGLLPLIEEFCKTVPVGELHFRKDSSFWDVIGGSRRSDG